MAVQESVYTYNPTCDYEFSWTIEKFSILPGVFRGPSLSPIPGIPKKVCFEIGYEKINGKAHMRVSLVDLSGKDGIVFKLIYTSICNTDGKILSEARSSSFSELRGSKYLLNYIGGSNLLEDKLIVVKGKLSFSGYAISSNVSLVSVNDDSEACRDLSKDLKTMYESGLSCDVTFSVGGKTLRAHKVILLNRSPVFAKMFNSNMLEGNSNKVVIKDADYHAFNCFLMFLYTGIVEDKKWDTVLSLYSLAHKYQVKNLHAICSGILGRSLAIDSACNILVLSDLHGDEELKNIAKVFILRHIIQLAGTIEWIELATTKPQLVKDVLSSMASPTTMK